MTLPEPIFHAQAAELSISKGIKPIVQSNNRQNIYGRDGTHVRVLKSLDSEGDQICLKKQIWKKIAAVEKHSKARFQKGSCQRN